MQTVRYILNACCVLLVLAGVAACTQAPPPSKQEVVASLTDDLIIPRFQTVAMEMDQLNGALVSLCSSPGADTLAAARTAWREARVPWMRSQATWFGPVMDRRSRSLVDWSPVNPERIEKLLAEREAISANDVTEFLSSTQRGLGAIEYVLFAADEDVLQRLDQSNGIGCQYLTALGEVISVEMNSVRDEWAGGGDQDYGAYFKGTARVALLEQQAVDEAVRTSVFITRSTADMRLGKAIGADGGEPEPSAIPGAGAQNAVADLRNQVLGMQDVYLGAGTDGTHGISALVRGVSEEADDRMRTHFTDTLAAIDELQEPLQSTVLENPGPARAAHQQVRELQRALNTEVVSLLGVTVGFADTDGDGG